MKQVLLICIALLWAQVISVAYASHVSSANFKKDFHATWGEDHVHPSHNGHTTTLVLDNKSGAEITSNRQFLFGRYDVKIKVTKGKSSTGVVTYKLTSSDANRDEIHYEFLPEKKGYSLQTNIYINGQGYREQKFNLSFDPTAKFNEYSIIWNTHHVVFKVNEKTIRAFKSQGSFRNATKPMNLQASIYYKNGNQATEVEAEIANKQEWSKNTSPSSVSFKDFKINACAADQVRSANECREFNTNKLLTSEEATDIKDVMNKYLIYDYCKDSQRNQERKECSSEN